MTSSEPESCPAVYPHRRGWLLVGCGVMAGLVVRASTVLDGGGVPPVPLPRWGRRRGGAWPDRSPTRWGLPRISFRTVEGGVLDRRS